MNFTEMLQSYTGKPLADCTNQESCIWPCWRSSGIRVPIKCSLSQGVNCIISALSF